MALFRYLAVFFALLLAIIILTANLGLAGELFGPVYDFPYGDKIAHFSLMGILSMLLSLGFRWGRVDVLGIKMLKSSLILAAFVTLEEVSQEFLPNRSFSLLDLSANYAGVIIMGEIGRLLRRAMTWQRSA